MAHPHVFKRSDFFSHSNLNFLFCTKTYKVKEQLRNIENQRNTARNSKNQSAKMNTMSKVKFIDEADLPTEIKSQRDKLDFSQIKMGPGCSGCYTLVFDTVCGHPFVYRKRCQPQGPVCAGSEILFVHLEDIVLRRTTCTSCRFLSIDNHRFKKTQKRKRGQPALSPKKLAAKMRLEEGKEKWKRRCLQVDVAERDRLSAESADPQASPQGKGGDVEIVDLTMEEPTSE